MTPFMEDPFAKFGHKLFIARFLISVKIMLACFLELIFRKITRKVAEGMGLEIGRSKYKLLCKIKFKMYVYKSKRNT